MSATILLAALATAATAQDFTRLSIEASTDNVNWSPSIAIGAPGPCYFRVTVTRSGPTPMSGLGSVIFQPVIDTSHGGPSVVVSTFSNVQAGVNTNSGAPAMLGRLNPFAANPMTSNTSGTLRSFTEGSLIRFAGSRATTPTTFLVWGVPSEQREPILAGTSFNTASSVVVFKFAATFSDPGLYWIDIPYDWINSPRDASAYWYTIATGTGDPKRVLVDPAEIRAASVYVGGSPCTLGGTFATRDPRSLRVLAGRRAAFHADAIDCSGVPGIRWFHDGAPLSDNGHIQGAGTTRLVINNVAATDAGQYIMRATGAATAFTQPATLTVSCPGDVDDGNNTGTPDASVDINDLLHFLTRYEQRSIAADLDDGEGLGLGDSAVTIDDLLYFLARFEIGC